MNSESQRKTYILKGKIRRFRSIEHIGEVPILFVLYIFKKR